MKRGPSSDGTLAHARCPWRLGHTARSEVGSKFREPFRLGPM